MARIGVIVLADAESHADMGRMANALELAKEAKENGDVVTIIFDGAGTRWVPELTNPDHDLHKLYSTVKDTVQGACAFCAAAFHVRDKIKQTDVPLVGDFDGHPSLRTLIAEGYELVTF